MHKHSYYILPLLTILFCQNIFCMEKQCPVYNFSGKVIVSYVTQPGCVAWLADNTIALAGTGGLDLFDPTTQQSIAQTYNIKSDPQDCVYDIATNNDQTQVATASFKHIVHYDSNEKKVVSEILTDTSQQNCVGFLSNNLVYCNENPATQDIYRYIILPYSPQKKKYLIMRNIVNRVFDKLNI